MAENSKTPAFAKYAWFVLAYNVVVIIWGVFLRASHSGDGCGQHWLTCQGEVIPSAPQLKTVIEYSHRLTTGLASITVLVLLIWAFRRYGKGEAARRAAALSFAFIVIESLIGAGLVLTGNTADNWTPSRPFWAIGHLINTFLLLASLTLTAWLASEGRTISLKASAKAKALLLSGVFAIFLVGSTGSLAALSNMLFPSETIVEGVASDFAPTSPLLLRLRISHPIVSIAAAVFLILLAGWMRKDAVGRTGVKKRADLLTGLVLVQLASGAATLLLHAPILMQLLHLFLADAVWIVFVLLWAEYLSDGEPAAAGFE